MTSRRLIDVRRLLAAFAALVLVGVVLAGCGGSSAAGGAAGAAGTDGRAAQAFPASTVAFADANIDEKSDAWKRLLAAGRALPELAEARGGVRQGREQGHRRRADARAGALLAGHRGCDRRPRRPGRRLRPDSARVRRGHRQEQPRGRAHEAEGREGRRHARRLRRLHRQQGLGLGHRHLGRHRPRLELAGGGHRRDRPSRRLERSPVRLRRLQGHARDAAERQHRRRLRAGVDAAEARRVLAATRARGRARRGAAGAARSDLVEARRHPHPRLRNQRDRRGPPHPRDDAAQRQGDRPARAVHARPARPRARELLVRSDVRQPRRDHQAGGRSGARHQRRRAEAGLPGRGPARHQAGRPLRAALRRPGRLRRARRSGLGGPDPAPDRRVQGRHDDALADEAPELRRASRSRTPRTASRPPSRASSCTGARSTT